MKKEDKPRLKLTDGMWYCSSVWDTPLSVGRGKTKDLAYTNWVCRGAFRLMTVEDFEDSIPTSKQDPMDFKTLKKGKL